MNNLVDSRRKSIITSITLLQPHRYLKLKSSDDNGIISSVISEPPKTSARPLTDDALKTVEFKNGPDTQVSNFQVEENIQPDATVQAYNASNTNNEHNNTISNESLKKNDNEGLTQLPINITSLLASISESDAEYTTAPIQPSLSKEEKDDVAAEHDAEPIKNPQDIYRIKQHFLENKKYRDYMLFVVGINVGLRGSDLRLLKFENFLNPNSTFKKELIILEKKTKNTRGKKYLTDENGNDILDDNGNKKYICKQKNRHIPINKNTREAIVFYLSQNPYKSLDNYLFVNESNNRKSDNEPIIVRTIQYILTNACNSLNLQLRSGSHMLRKTFAYHFIISHKDRTRALEDLQLALGHSSISVTKHYAGVTSDEMEEAYNNLKFGDENIIDCGYLE